MSRKLRSVTTGRKDYCTHQDAILLDLEALDEKKRSQVLKLMPTELKSWLPHEYAQHIPDEEDVLKLSDIVEKGKTRRQVLIEDIERVRDDEKAALTDERIIRHAAMGILLKWSDFGAPEGKLSTQQIFYARRILFLDGFNSDLLGQAYYELQLHIPKPNKFKFPLPTLLDPEDNYVPYLMDSARTPCEVSEYVPPDVGHAVNAFQLPGNTSVVVRSNAVIYVPLNMNMPIVNRARLLVRGIEIGASVADAGYYGMIEFFITNRVSEPVWLYDSFPIAKMMFEITSQTYFSSHIRPWLHSKRNMELPIISAPKSG